MVEQLKLLTSTVFRLRSLVTGIQKAAVLLMLISGLGAFLVGLSLIILGASWWFTWFSFVLFMVPAGLLWWWRSRLDPTLEMLSSAHSVLASEDSVDGFAKSLGQGREWVVVEMGKLETTLVGSGTEAESRSWISAISPLRLAKSAIQVRRASDAVSESFVGQLTSTVAVLNLATLTAVGFLAAAAISSVVIGLLMLALVLLLTMAGA